MGTIPRRAFRSIELLKNSTKLNTGFQTVYPDLSAVIQERPTFTSYAYKSPAVFCASQKCRQTMMEHSHFLPNRRFTYFVESIQGFESSLNIEDLCSVERARHKQQKSDERIVRFNSFFRCASIRCPVATSYENCNIPCPINV